MNLNEMNLNAIDRMWSGHVTEEEEKRHEELKKRNEFQQALFNAVRNDNIVKVSAIIDDYDQELIKSALRIAYGLNHTSMVKFLLSKCNWNDINDPLFYACWLGDSTQVEICISKGAHKWDRGLYGACKGCNTKNHYDIAKRMVALGARDFDAALHALCYNRNQTREHLILLNYMIKHDVKKIWHNLFHFMPYFIDRFHANNWSSWSLNYFDKCTVDFIIKARAIQKQRLYNVVDKFMCETNMSPFICGFSSSRIFISDKDN